MVKRARSQFRFDVALSFAGRDRQQAERIVKAMKDRGLRVFYDKDLRSYLWGKRSKEFERIYSVDSAFVIPLVSAHYPDRDWTQWEFGSAKREAKRRSGDFILPIRLDETRLFGLPDDFVYLDANEISPEEIADAVEQKLESEYSQGHPAPDHSTKDLPLSAITALGLIVSAPVVLSLPDLKSFFPDVDWKRHIRAIRKAGLLVESKDEIAAKKGIKRLFASEIADLESRWAVRLEELSHYPDCALLLSSYYLSNKRYDDAISILTSAAIDLEPGWLIEIYSSVFQKLYRHPKIWRRLSPDSRAEFHHAFGRCLLADSRSEEARDQFERLRLASKRLRDDEGVGLALLNIGICYDNGGDHDSARKWYVLARKHGFKYNQTSLTSHSLANLGQLELEYDPEKAIEFLELAAEQMRVCDDHCGIAITTQVLAVAHAKVDQFDKASELYNQAEKMAEDLDLRYLRCLILNNKAHTLLRRGKRTESMRIFRKARRIADSEEYKELRARSTEGICRIQYLKKQFEDTVTSALELVDLARAASLPDFEMTAHHFLWASYSLLGEMRKASQRSANLTRIARKHKVYGWLVRAIVDRSRVIDGPDFGPPDSRKLRQMIRAESRRDDAAATGALWFALAEVLKSQDIDGAVRALDSSFKCYTESQDMTDNALESLKHMYVLQWEAKRFDDAIGTLDSVIGFAAKCSSGRTEVAAIDEKGICLQKLERYEEAITVHDRAVGRARKLGLRNLLVNSLSNKAECYRRSGDLTSAVKVFEMAGAVAAKLNDVEAIIQTDHGRGLALEELGNYDTALSIFKRCRSRSARIGCWSEHVRALEAIASLAWVRNRKKTAVKQFELALAASKEHSVLESMLRIALNLSRLLWSIGYVPRARQLLAEHIDAVTDPFALSEFHSTLAEFCEGAGRVEDARKHWQFAIESAEAVSNEDDLVFCKSQYAEFEMKQKCDGIAISELEELLKKKISAENRSIILTQLLNALLQANLESRASEVFDLAEKHMRENDHTAHLIDIHMHVFDHNWKGNRESRLQSLQAYAIAFLSAAGDPELEEQLGDIVSHVMRTLTDRISAPTLRQLEWLGAQFEKWLSDLLGECDESSNQDSSSEVFNQLLQNTTMPFRYALRVIPFNNNPARFLAEHKKFWNEIEKDSSVR